MGALLIVFLLIGAKQRHGHDNPPDGHQQKGDSHGSLHGDSQALIEEDKHQTDEERDAASDVSPGISTGGDLVHAAFVRDVCEHGIIDYKACGVGGFCQDKQ